MFSLWSSVARDGEGRYFVANEETPAEIEVYGSSGQFERRLGRSGGGPGEYRLIHRLEVKGGDTLVVYDRAQKRRTFIVSLDDVVRTELFPFDYRDKVAISDERSVVAATIHAPEQVGLPLHMVDTTGRILLSFGADTGDGAPGATVNNQRALTSGPEGIWAAFVTRYVIDLFDLSGRRLRRLQREAEWFEPWQLGVPPNPTTPPRPQVMAIRRDGRDLLWTVLLVPAERWREAVVERPASASGRRHYTVGDMTKYYHSIIEVFDVRSGRLLAAARLAQPVLQFLDDEHVVAFREGDDDLPRLDVWRIQFIR